MKLRLFVFFAVVFLALTSREPPWADAHVTYDTTQSLIDHFSLDVHTEGGPPWDILQLSTAVHDQILVDATQSDEGVSQINVKPIGLQPDTTYDVESVDTGLLGTATGEALMTDGIDILQSPGPAAHMLIVTARQ